MKKKKPCNNCPMRVDYEKLEWSNEQIENILHIDNENNSLCDLESGKAFEQMACHKSKEGSEFPCVGWVISQLQNGVTNFGLRISLIEKRINKSDFDLDFKVHKNIKTAFEAKGYGKKEK